MKSELISNAPGDFAPLKVTPLFLLLSYVTIVGAIAWYSRFILLFSQPIATLGVTIIALSVLIFFFAWPKFGDFKFLFFLLLTVVLLFLSLMVFTIRTGLSGDWRTIGNFCGIFLVFPIVYIIRRFTLEIAIRIIYNIFLAYTMLYLVVSLGVAFFDWFADVEPRGVILQDPVRGRRVFACASILFFVLFYSLAKLYENRGNKFLIPIALSVLALYFSQSRTPITLSFFVLFSLFVLGRQMSLIFGKITASIFIVFGIASMISLGALKDVLFWLDPETMTLRVLNLDIAYENFQNYPLFGFGYPGDAGFNVMVFGQYYYPEDLGAVGVLATFGIVGVCWFLAAFLIALSGMRICLKRAASPTMAAVGASGLFVLLFTNFWPTLLVGDGGLIFSMLFAIVVVQSDGVDRTGDTT